MITLNMAQARVRNRKSSNDIADQLDTTLVAYRRNKLSKWLIVQ